MLDRRTQTNEILNGLRPVGAPHRLLPEVSVIKIGGQSVMDRGAEAVMPVIEQIRAAHAEGCKMIVCTGGGTRSRHIYQLAGDLNLPPGILAKAGEAVAKQNARMVQMLLADIGSVHIHAENLEELPAYLASRCIPIMSGMPPYEYWTRPPSGGGRVPDERTDVGTYLLAEVIGAKRCVFVKDEDSLYTDDPKRNPDATRIDHGAVSHLESLGLPDLIIERVLLDMLKKARFVKQIRVVNAMRPGQLLAALRDEPVGFLFDGTK